MKTAGIMVVVLLVLVLVIGMWVYGSYNKLVNLDENVNQAFAQVDVVLQRRFDLIPNLVETVKGYAAHERDVFIRVTEARSRVGSAQTPDQKITANNELSGALGRLLLVAENYPQLQANQNFLALQDELAGTENRIAVERRRNNEAATEYNKAIRRVPGNVIAGMFGFERREVLQAPAEAKVAPKVTF